MNQVLILFSQCDLDGGAKEAVREEVKQRTGEDCIILGPEFNNAKKIVSDRERAAHLRAWTARDD